MDEEYIGPWSHFSESDTEADLRWGTGFTDQLTLDDPLLPEIKERIATALVYMLLEHDLIQWIIKPPPAIPGIIPAITTVAGKLIILKP